MANEEVIPKVEEPSERLPEWAVKYPRKKTKYTPELALQSQAIMLNALSGYTEAPLRQFFRIRIDAVDISIGGITRWPTRESALEALKSSLRFRVEHEVERTGVFPKYIKRITPPWYAGGHSGVNIGNSYGSQEFKKDFEAVMASGRIQIVEQAEL